jgi:GNAT superfamily N-acetyltransferase
VVVDHEQRVRGFYALAAGAVAHQMATPSARRNMPDPVPVMVLGRLAVDRRAQGIQLGAALLQDAVHRAIAVSQNTGVRALLVHALHEQAKAFYAHYGFQVSPLHALTLMLRLT